MKMLRTFAFLLALAPLSANALLWNMTCTATCDILTDFTTGPSGTYDFDSASGLFPSVSVTGTAIVFGTPFIETWTSFIGDATIFSGLSAPTGVLLLVTLDSNMLATGGTIGGDWLVDLLGLGELRGRLQVTTEAAAVPEPGTLGLLGAGLIGLAWRRRGQWKSE